uniref:Uncharacterized protein n=1 Tax=Oryza glumipatula TaxID=40148 RepID=A0A0E0B7F2_9ORYZ
MEVALRTAGWLVGKLVDLLSAELLEALDNSYNLGANAHAIKAELLYTQGLLHKAQGRNVAHSPELAGLLLRVHPPVRHPRRPLPRSIESERMKSLMAQMQPLCAKICAKISDFLKLEVMDPKHRITALTNTAAAFSERVTTTTSTSLEAKLYGRQEEFYAAIKEITGSRDGLTVLPVLGPGESARQPSPNTFTTREIFNSLVAGEVSWRQGRISNIEEPHNLEQLHRQLEQMLQSKRFLLVLDDMWSCDSEYKWNKFLAPFRKTMVKGSTVIVTTRSDKITNMVKSGTDLLICLDSLNPEAFWAFFLACAFGDKKPADHKDLLDLGREIVKKLRSSPLAAKTVGRLLKKDLTRRHWSRVLNSKEWEHEGNVDDIMPALKLSYDCLPFHLQKCFTFCALFPDDYQYQDSELTHLWSALGVITCSGQDGRIQDIGLRYINELVSNGIFQKVDGVKFSHEKGREVKHTYYVMHGLLHQLARIISSRECLSIDCSNPSLVYTPSSIRHLSITIRSTGDTLGVDHYQKFKENMANLKEQISIANLHTLMFIGECDERFSEAFKEILKEIKHVRVLRLFQTTLELPRKLIHLRYLRIQASRKPMNTQLQSNRSVTQERDQHTMGETQTPATNDSSASLPSSLPEYYHLRFLDLQDWMGMPEVPEGMHISRLIHLHQFLATKKLQSSVAEVGKLKLLKELAMFQVKRGDRDGFELQQLGELRDLGGALTISNLHKVKTRAEAEKAKLKLKRNLVRLKLVWDEAGSEQIVEEANSIEGLQPPANLRELCIKNHKGNTCPSWFHRAISYKALEVLHLHGVSWNTFPPFGQIPYLRKLKLENIAIENFEVRDESLENLRSIEFIGMPNMKTWVSTNLFTQLQQLKVLNCPVLRELPLSQNLQLSQTPTQQDFRLQILAVIFQRYFQAFPVQQKCSMPNLHELVVQVCPELSLPPMPYTPMLQLVEVATRQYILLYNKYTLEIRGTDNNWCGLGNLDNVLAFHDMKWLVRVTIKVCSSVPLATLQKLTSLEALTFEDCSNLSSGRGENAVIKISIKHLVLRKCNITGKELSKILACCPYLSHLEMEDCNGITGLCMQQSVHEMDDDGSDVGVLQFPSKSTSTLSRLGIFSRDDITLNVSSEVLGKLKSLQWLQLGGCVLSCAAMQAVNDDHPLENHLKVLRAYGYDMPVLVQDWLMTRMARTVVAASFQLEELDIGSISGVLDVQICDHHFSTSLRRLTFRNDKLLQSFTEDQETALRKFTSLQELVFYGCDRLQSLPSSLRTLPSLKRLEVSFRQLQGICLSQHDNIECTFNKKDCLEACNGSTYMG